MTNFVLSTYIWGVAVNALLIAIVFILSGCSWYELSAKYRMLFGIDVSPTKMQWRVVYLTLFWPVDCILMLIRFCRTGKLLP